MSDLDKLRTELKILLALDIERMKRERHELMLHAIKYGSIIIVLIIGLICWEYFFVKPYFERLK